MKAIIICVLVTLVSISNAKPQYNYNEESELLMTLDGRISGMKSRMGKDIVIGGLAYVHESANGKCLETILQHNHVESLEALLYAIDVINSDPNILPNLTLGYDIRDTCGSENVGLDEAIDIIYSNGQIEIESCSAEFDNDTQTPVSAVIGAINSPVTISVAGLFRYFKIPQVSFSSTSTLLNNRESYPYFFRTIPGDNHQVQAMIDLILHFKWDHVSTLYSSNRYGQPAINAFHKLANEKGICLDISESLEEKSDYDSIASKLYNSTANVVKKSSRPKFIAPPYQIGFTLILMCFPVFLVIVSLIVAPPEANRAIQYNKVNHNSHPELIVTCSSPHVAFIVLQMIYFSGLLIASNALAVMTIRFPINFNEAKYVAFATFSLVLTWFFFMLAFIVSQNTPYQGAALSTAIQVSAVAVLLSLFGPRVFIMIAWPHRNAERHSSVISKIMPLGTQNRTSIMPSDDNKIASNKKNNETEE
uniref:G-protein coupled receptors family 3 profile domain-containing protein n=1 Tax=Amphimedon queenslandica TaxID=400682 RepID=A0A1X7V223_AMPQE